MGCRNPAFCFCAGLAALRSPDRAYVCAAWLPLPCEVGPVSVIARGGAIQIRQVRAAPPHALPSCRRLRTAHVWTVSGFCRHECRHRQLLHMGDGGATLPGRGLQAAQVGGLRIPPASSQGLPADASKGWRKDGGQSLLKSPLRMQSSRKDQLVPAKGMTSFTCTSRALPGSGVDVRDVVPSLSSWTHRQVAVGAGSEEWAKGVQKRWWQSGQVKLSIDLNVKHLCHS